jgi:site-specific DNA recombinase
MNNIKRAVVYVRVSTTQQVDGASLDNQEERCQEWALKNGVLIKRTFREEGASAKTTDRPELKKMLGFLGDNGKDIDYLIIYEVDRLARNTEDFFAITSELNKQKIQLKDPSSSLEGSKSDKLIRYIKAIAAEIDNDVKSERVVDNMKRHASDGYRMAKAPYGLQNTRDLLGKSILTKQPIVGDKIAQLLDEFSTDTVTIKELIKLAEEIGLVRPNGKPMNHSYIGKILRNPTYAGLEKNVHTNNQYVETSQFDGIIDKDTYWRNQRILDRRKGAKVETYSVNHPDFPLRRFLLCAACKSPVRGSAPTGGSGKSYPKYHCTRCSKASIVAEELNEQFLDLLTHITPNKLSLRLIKIMIVRVWNDELRSLHVSRKKYQARINELEEHKQKATDKVVTDDITKHEKIEIHLKANKEIEGLKNSIDKLSRQIGTKQEAIDYVLSYMDNAPRIWADATPDMRALYQSMIFPEGIEYDFYKNKFGTPKLSALYTLANIKKDPSKSDESLLVISRRIELRLPG